MQMMRSTSEGDAMVQTTKYVTWRQLKAGMEIHGYKQEGRTCFCKGTVQSTNAAYVTILLWGTTPERIPSEETMFDVEMSREEFMQIHKVGAVEVMNALHRNLAEYETGNHAMDNGWIRYDPYEMAAHCKDRQIKVVGVFRGLPQVRKHHIDVAICCEREDGGKFWCHGSGLLLDGMLEEYKELLSVPQEVVQDG